MDVVVAMVEVVRGVMCSVAPLGCAFLRFKNCRILPVVDASWEDWVVVREEKDAPQVKWVGLGTRQERSGEGGVPVAVRRGSAYVASPG
jgi:hypothetical protein